MNRNLRIVLCGTLYRSNDKHASRDWGGVHFTQSHVNPTKQHHIMGGAMEGGGGWTVDAYSQPQACRSLACAKIRLCEGYFKVQFFGSKPICRLEIRLVEANSGYELLTTRYYSTNITTPILASVA